MSCLQKVFCHGDGFTNVFEFRPSDFVGDTPHLWCYGLITSDLQMVSILVGVKSIPLPQGGATKSDPQVVKVVKGRLLR